MRSEAVAQPTFTYQGQRFLWGYSPDRQICGLWEVGDPEGAAHQTWPISEHAAAWRVFRSLEPFAACIQPADASSKQEAGQGAAPEVLADGPDAGRSKSRRRRLALAASLLVVVAAGAVFAVRTVGSKAAVSPAKAVLTAASTTQHLHSAQMSMTETITGISGAGAITVTGSGGVDFSTRDVSLTMSVQGEHLSVLSSDGNVFVGVPQISQLLPGKSWVSVPVGNTSSAAGSSLSSSDPTQMLQLLAARGNTVSSIGSSTIDGVPVEGYAVLINKTAAGAQLSSSGLPPSAVQAGERVLEMAGPIVYKVYVDSDSQLRAINFSMAVPGVSGASLHAGITLSDFGFPVSLTAPPASEVASYAQFLYATVAAGGSAPF